MNKFVVEWCNYWGHDNQNSKFYIIAYDKEEAKELFLMTFNTKKNKIRAEDSIEDIYEYEEPEFNTKIDIYSRQCLDCIWWTFGDSSVGLPAGCEHEDLWGENGEEIDELAFDYQEGFEKCPYRELSNHL